MRPARGAGVSSSSRLRYIFRLFEICLPYFHDDQEAGRLGGPFICSSIHPSTHPSFTHSLVRQPVTRHLLCTTQGTGATATTRQALTPALLEFTVW